jgi:pimeloyl-ACP methyl ester carboxylesterase
VTGLTQSPDFPLLNAFQPTPGTDGSDEIQDAFVLKINAAGDNRRPLVIVPDLGASYLTNSALSTLPWPNDVQQPAGDPTTLQCDTNGIVLTALTATNFLSGHPVIGLVDFLLDSGYARGASLFEFPYDFRQSVPQVAAALAARIAEIKVLAGTNKVDIVAHGLGGLVAKQYMADGNDTNVGTCVMIGAPHLGMPKALKMLRYGDDFGLGLLGIAADTHKAKRAAHNWPGLFNLLPSSNYFERANGGYFFDGADLDGDGVRGLLNYSNTVINLKYGDENFAQLQPADPAPTNGLSAIMLDTDMEAFHQVLDVWAKPAGVRVFNIAGYGVSTLARLAETPKNIAETNTVVDLVPTPAGDGMVPLISANAVAANGRYYADYQALQAGHASALADIQIQKQVLHLLGGGPGGGVFGEQIATNWPASLDPQMAFASHSPVRINVQDSQGNQTGVLPDGSTQAEIPGSSVDQIGDRQFVSVPEGGTYSVVITGTGTGTFGFSQSDVNSGGTVLKTLYWPSVSTVEDALSELLTKFGAREPIMQSTGKAIRPNSSDLVGQWVSFTQTRRMAGNDPIYTLRGRVLIKNRGRVAAANSTVRVFLSGDAVLDPNTDQLIWEGTTGVLKPGYGKKSDLPAVELADGESASGLYLIGVADFDGIVPETDETNNKFVFGRIR